MRSVSRSCCPTREIRVRPTPPSALRSPSSQVVPWCVPKPPAPTSSARSIWLSTSYASLRRTRDRRKDHRRGYTDPVPVDLGPVEPVVVEEPEPEAPNNSPADAVSADLGPGESVEVQVGDTPIVIRRKLHIAEPMTIDEALYEMELIGHDFFLFVNKETGRPSVVYHRHGWSYGVFEIDTPENVAKK